MAVSLMSVHCTTLCTPQSTFSLQGHSTIVKLYSSSLVIKWAITVSMHDEESKTKKQICYRPRTKYKGM